MSEEILSGNNLIEMEFGRSSLTVNPHGNRVEKLILNGTDIFWKGIRPDGNPASSHLSAPWFGPYKGSLPEGVENPGYHGPGRKDLWSVARYSKEDADLTLQVENLEVLYPHLDMFSSVSLDHNMFAQLLSFHNTGSEPQSRINPGIHWYWKIPAEKASEVIINGTTTPLEKWLEAELIEAKYDNFIEIPDLGSYRIKQKGFSHIILWTQKDADFSCIELGHDPVKIDESPILQPNSYTHMSATISKI